MAITINETIIINEYKYIKINKKIKIKDVIILFFNSMPIK